VIATDDDPDTENRLKILRQLVEKINYKENTHKQLYIIPEREFAIKFATEIAQP
jgi:UDP-N-acetylmuramyl tripeptide synthase